MEHDAPIPSLSSLGSLTNQAIQDHWDRTIRRFLRAGHGVVNDRYAMISTGEAHPFGNFASVSMPRNIVAVGEAINSLPNDIPSALVLPIDSPTPDVQSLLERRGYVLGEEMPTMGVEIERLADAPVAPEYEFVRIDADRAKEWGRAFEVGYGIPPKVAMSFASPSREHESSPAQDLEFYAGAHDGELVCTAAVHCADGIAGIYCISTLPEHRRRGLGAWITVESLRASKQIGYQVSVLQASLAGHPVYERLGFKRFGSMLLYVRVPG